MDTVADIAWAAVAEATIMAGAAVAETAIIVTIDADFRRELLSLIYCSDESKYRRYERSRRQARPVQLQ